jgi:hypothetical protein
LHSGSGLDGQPRIAFTGLDPVREIGRIRRQRDLLDTDLYDLECRVDFDN